MGPDRHAAAAAKLPGRRACLAAAWGATLAGSGLLAGCASRPAAPPSHGHAALPADRVQPFSGTAAGDLPAGWRPFAMRRDLRQTRYSATQLDGRRVLHAQASSSATALRCAVQIDPQQRRQLHFSWRTPAVPTRSNVAEAEHDDCPARLVIAFDGDEQRLPLRERLFYEQVELFTGHRLPFATLMYVWDGGQHAPESVHRNHRSQRIQYLTVESGNARVGQWLHYQRDVVADYHRVYGEAPGTITSVGVLTDADALKLDQEAWYGDIRLTA